MEMTTDEMKIAADVQKFKDAASYIITQKNSSESEAKALYDKVNALLESRSQLTSLFENAVWAEYPHLAPTPAEELLKNSYQMVLPIYDTFSQKMDSLAAEVSQAIEEYKAHKAQVARSDKNLVNLLDSYRGFTLSKINAPVCPPTVEEFASDLKMSEAFPIVDTNKMVADASIYDDLSPESRATLIENITHEEFSHPLQANPFSEFFDQSVNTTQLKWIGAAALIGLLLMR